MYKKLKCAKCAHEWMPHDAQKLPQKCPKCQRRNWNDWAIKNKKAKVVL